jgi:uncharacterized protein YecE (DUF72 family)
LKAFRKITDRRHQKYVYFSNHYEGFAVASVERFRRLCAAGGIETQLNVQLPAETEPTLFDISPH